MPLMIALVAGFLFGLRLIVSGMINQQKVLVFLDIAWRDLGRSRRFFRMRLR